MRHFSGAEFIGDTDFIGAEFSKDANFSGAQFSQKLDFHMLQYEQLFINWESIKDHLEYDGATYLSLIKNFRNLELFGDADACYYQYRKISQSKKDWYDGPNKLINFIISIYNTIISHLKWIMDFYHLVE